MAHGFRYDALHAKPIHLRARLLAALEADLVGPFALGAPNADPDEPHAATETLPMSSRTSERG